MRFEHEVLEIHIIDNKILVVYVWDNLSDTTSPKAWENVELFDENGNKIWTVNGMNKCPYWHNDNDTFVGAGYDGKNWGLSSFSGHSYSVNVETGHVTYESFHK